MRPGEEASIIENIEKILEECKNDLTILAFNGVKVLIKRILRRSDLEELLEFPLCIEQIECHWKLMATRLRYSNQLPI